MSAEGDLGYISGFRRYEERKAARLEREREIGLEDAKNKRDEEDRLRRQKREDEAAARAKLEQQRADDEYARTQAEADRVAYEEGLDGLARDLDSGLDVELSRRRFNSRGKVKLPEGGLMFDPETRIVRIREEDGVESEIPLDGLLKRYGGGKQEKPPGLIEVSPGASLYDPTTKRPVYTAPDRPRGGTGGSGGADEPAGPKPLTPPQLLSYAKDARRIVADTLQLKYDTATDRLIDAAPGATERWAQMAPEVDRLVRKYGSTYLPAEVAAVVVEAFKDVPDEDALVSDLEAKQKQGFWSMSVGDFKGDDVAARQAIGTAAKQERQRAVAAAKQRLAQLEAEIDSSLGRQGGGAPSRDDAIRQAREAIAGGRQRAGVIKKLRDMGIKFDESELD